MQDVVWRTKQCTGFVYLQFQTAEQSLPQNQESNTETLTLDHQQTNPEVLKHAFGTFSIVNIVFDSILNHKQIL